ncbi:hypothetical protein ACOSP7_016530 [Xanthoceras sorbifolium]
MQEGKNQPFESNDIISCIDVGGALLVFKCSGTSGLFKPGVVQLDDKIVIVGCGGGQNHVPLQTASESVLGGRKKRWKRWARTGMVIEEEASVSPQLGKRDSSIVGGLMSCRRKKLNRSFQMVMDWSHAFLTEFQAAAVHHSTAAVQDRAASSSKNGSESFLIRPIFFLALSPSPSSH